MAGLAWNRFRGIAPKIEPRLLPAPLGQKATNCRVFSGALEPWRAPLTVATPSKAVDGEVRSIFRMDDQAGGASKWLNWLTDVNVTRGFVADSTQRIYWSGDGEPRVSNYALATAGADMPTNWYVLGVPAPIDAPTIPSVTGGSTSGTRIYFYTFVTEWGEEGMRSPTVSTTNNTIGATWNLTLPATSLNNSGNVSNVASSGGVTTFTLASVEYLRAGETIVFAGLADAGAVMNGIEWTIATVAGSTVTVNTGSTYNPGGVAGVTYSRGAPHHVSNMTKSLYRQDASGVYRRVASGIALATTTYADTMENSALAASVAYVGDLWAMPPPDLVSLAEMPGSFMVGVSPSLGVLCMSQPGFPHAWPATYQQVIPFKPVGLGVFEQTVIIGTNGPPYIARGSSPTLLVPEKIDEQWPCLSRPGIVSMSDGVMYPTTNGYAIVGAGGARIITQDVIAADGFAAYAPATMRATRYQNRLFAWYETDDTAESGLIIDASEGIIDLVPVTVSASAAWTDPATGIMYLVADGEVQQWDAAQTRLTAEWRSSVKPTPKPASPSMARVEADYGDLSNTAVVAALLAALQAANTTLLSGSEAYPDEAITQGPIGDAMIGDSGIGDSHLYENLGLDAINSLQFRVWSDGVLVASINPTDGEPFILPVSDEPGRRFEVGVITTIPVQAIELAESAEDLAQMAP
jgi:hypothetical protein